MSNIEKSFVRGFIKFLNKQIQEKDAEKAESLEGENCNNFRNHFTQFVRMYLIKILNFNRFILLIIHKLLKWHIKPHNHYLPEIYFLFTVP